jgi:predicted ferric reductase
MSSKPDGDKTASSPAGLISAILLTVTSVVLAVVAWRQINPGPLDELSPYAVFPLFGLIAFSLMWCMYAINALTKYLEIDSDPLTIYYRVAGYGVLAAILAHPLTFVVSLWRDGFGLPPGSYAAYLGPNLAWVALIGTTCLFIFLAFELHRWFAQKKWWKWVIYANDLAMLAIFYHGYRIGGELQSGWFRYVWFFYGVMLVVCLIYLRVILRLRIGRAAK